MQDFAEACLSTSSKMLGTSDSQGSSPSKQAIANPRGPGDMRASSAEPSGRRRLTVVGVANSILGLGRLSKLAEFLR